jgi:two-component system sensor histidine kinase KdpD
MGPDPGAPDLAINGEANRREPQRAITQRPQQRDIGGYVAAVGLVTLATAIGWPLYHVLAIENVNILMLYLLAVLWVASRHSRSAAILASVLGVALFDFCFVPPYYTFNVADQQYLVTFATMLITALVISTLTHRVRAHAEAARERERRTAAMVALNRDLAAARGTDDAAAATVKHIGDVFDSRTILLLPDPDRRLLLRAASNGDASIDPDELSVAQWAFEHHQPAGAGTTTLPAARALYLPLKSSRGVVGVVGIFAPVDGSTFSSERRGLAEAFASQAALAIERAQLAEEARVAWERVEAEFLRNTLLSGVSHELRTPLAAITGAVSTLIETPEQLSTSTRAEMLDTILSESDRMERLISNLLDMTRMESGGLVLRKEWQPLAEVVGSALHHLKRRLLGREVLTNVAADLPLVQIDAIAIEQVLTNLIDNAAEYTPANTPIQINAHAEANEMIVEIADQGGGLPSGTESRVFEKFFRIRSGESRRGIGLGLAIARGIVEAHGGKISASNRAGGGAVFRFTIPLIGTPPALDDSTRETQVVQADV